MGMVVDMLAQIAGQKRVTGQDVLAARAVIYADMEVSADEAASLFSINDTVVDDCPEWRHLFIEAMTDYVVRQQEPRGFIDDAKALWLEEWILADGKVRGETELELLIYILEQANQAPEALFRLAMHHVRDQVLSQVWPGGEGPTITKAEVDQIRRILYAFAGSGGGAAVSRMEAEVLFELNDAARGRPNDPSWTELFAKAVGASLMVSSGYAPSREDAVRQDAWLKAPNGGVLSFYSRMLGSLARPAVFGQRAAADDAVMWARNAQQATDALAAAPVTDVEAEWLIAQIGRDSVLDENELALLQFVAQEAEGMPASLEALMQRAKDQAGPAVFERRVG